jgi:hypothetical protein
MEQMAVTTKELGWIVFVVCPQHPREEEERQPRIGDGI